MILSIVVPVFNEELSISPFYQAVRNLHLAHEGYTVEIIFINDGSTDNTRSAICSLQQQDPHIILINFSRNFGKEAALFAGLKHASGDAVIPMDVDLQDPISLLPDLVAKWRQGADVVLAKRIDRRTDNFLKRICAQGYYFIHNVLSHEKIEHNVGDFRLMSRGIVQEIINLPERTLFMKGLMSWVGGKTATVEYSRPERQNGETKFRGWKLWNFALDGITSFSTLPLRIWVYIGSLIAAGSVLYGFWVIISKLMWGNAVSGYASLMTVLLFLGGVQLIGIGVLGEYIGRIFTEAKHRPRYIIESILPETLNTEGNDSEE
ncbi:glycosyltransferase family 2 protein [Budvicia diplopodorum]|uniref:glycosyltransferase family 2 protein n=1 Tax=Budvicia diplopodorum TaxID=1119056 RepID=UPI00135925BE|nr:glycosyltransferase family 2 protein [Budvicia diplopodorum]